MGRAQCCSSRLRSAATADVARRGRTHWWPLRKRARQEPRSPNWFDFVGDSQGKRAYQGPRGSAPPCSRYPNVRLLIDARYRRSGPNGSRLMLIPKAEERGNGRGRQKGPHSLLIPKEKERSDGRGGARPLPVVRPDCDRAHTTPLRPGVSILATFRSPRKLASSAKLRYRIISEFANQLDISMRNTPN